MPEAVMFYYRKNGGAPNTTVLTRYECPACGHSLFYEEPEQHSHMFHIHQWKYECAMCSKVEHFTVQLHRGPV